MPSTTKAINYWPDDACAKAFWGQHVLPPYRQLLRDTAAWLEPKAGERWLDLGCGCGQLAKAVWQQSGGAVAEVIGLDCAPANAQAFVKLRASLQPAPTEDALRFVAGDFSRGLAAWSGEHFDGVVSGLAVQYAESYSEVEGRWTCEAYDRLLAEAARLLRAGGRFVFSVNVPEPSWGGVALRSLPAALRRRNPLRYLLKCYRMWRYGGWLKRQARQGRFHYLPLPIVLGKLAAAGFVRVEHRLSFAGQAYLLRAWKPTPGAQAA
ncbi:MAG TPA: methyltransferase domain-containing protein [Gemmataceae bacterium]|nr:methyltransferase domain-containing protein [Gemmataceae bacterium]